MYKKGYKIFALATILLVFFIKKYFNQHKISSLIKILKNFSKLLVNQQPTQQSPPTRHPRNLQQHQHPVRQITLNHQHVFHFNKTHIHLRNSLLSEPSEPVVCHAPLSEPQYEPIYNIYPSLQHELNRTRHPIQNQSASAIDRQVIHPRRNRNFKTPRVHFNIPS